MGERPSVRGLGIGFELCRNSRTFPHILTRSFAMEYRQPLSGQPRSDDEIHQGHQATSIQWRFGRTPVPILNSRKRHGTHAYLHGEKVARRHPFSFTVTIC
jgi:hypothetical protein